MSDKLNRFAFEPNEKLLKEGDMRWSQKIGQ